MKDEEYIRELRNELMLICYAHQWEVERRVLATFPGVTAATVQQYMVKYLYSQVIYEPRIREYRL